MCTIIDPLLWGIFPKLLKTTLLNICIVPAPVELTIHNILKFYVTSPSLNVATWIRPIQIICPHPFYQIISIVQQRFSMTLGIVCKTLKGYSLHFKNGAGATKWEQKQMTKESTETIQDMILRAWYSKRELMLAIVTAAHMWGCGIA